MEIAVPIPVDVPEGCHVKDVSIQAESDEAFDRAVKELPGVGTPTEISNTQERDGVTYAYSYRVAWGRGFTLSGPRREMKLVPVDG